MNLQLIEDYIEQNRPNGMIKLAIEANCSPALIHKIRHGHLPNLGVAMSLAQTLDVSLDDLCRVPKQKRGVKKAAAWA